MRVELRVKVEVRLRVQVRLGLGLRRWVVLGLGAGALESDLRSLLRAREKRAE